MPPRIHLIAAARPNFMKVAPIWRAMQRRDGQFDARLIHTGQHYDANMSDVFFADLGLPRPHLHLGVGSGSHAEQTAGVLVKYEAVCRAEHPDLVLVVGDVNATLAATLAARKLQIPVGHVEAGLRSRDRTMPEEVNRVVTDTIADLLFTPSVDGDANLLAEGVPAERIHRVGNVMIDSLVEALDRIKGSERHVAHGLRDGGYGLVTLHRPSNVDEPDRLRRLCEVLGALDFPLLFPVHPRTRKVMQGHGLWERWGNGSGPVRLCDPLGYDEFLDLMVHARLVITDSGGIQEETTYLGIPCLTLRPNTERPVTITQGTNELATLETLPDLAGRAIAGHWKKGRVPELWDGRTAERIVDIVARYCAGSGGERA
ncbi:MAG: UDP-N-acetylglucosamine 2-epimerase (non-hydrolyzing) [Candidatus Krumholzibacteriia bacterium]